MSYENLNDTVEKIIDAAIEAAMYNNGWMGDVKTGFTASMNQDVHIAPPGNPRSSGGQVTRGGEPYELTDGVDPGPDVYGMWEREIREAFRHWDDLPDPAHFNEPVQAMSDAAWEISVVTAGQEVTEMGNPGMESLDYLRDKTVLMESATISTFSELYAYPLPAIVHGQYELVALGALTLAAEQRVWKRARRDIADVADKGLTAMRSAHYQAGGVDLKSLVETVGALATIAGAFPTPAQPILSGAGSVLSSLGSLMDDPKEPTKPEMALGADTPEKCLENIRAAITRLNLAIIDEEIEMGEKIEKALSTVSERAGSFNLPRPELVTVPVDQLNGEIKHDRAEVDTISHTTLPRLAGFLSTSSGRIPDAKNSHHWQRGGLIGLTPYGSYVKWAELVTQASQLMSNTGWELLEAATHLQDAIGEVDAADEAAETDLRKRSRELAQDLDYTPPGAEQYGGAPPSLPPYAP